MSRFDFPTPCLLTGLPVAQLYSSLRSLMRARAFSTRLSCRCGFLDACRIEDSSGVVRTLQMCAVRSKAPRAICTVLVWSESKIQRLWGTRFSCELPILWTWRVIPVCRSLRTCFVGGCRLGFSDSGEHIPSDLSLWATKLGWFLLESRWKAQLSVKKGEVAIGIQLNQDTFCEGVNPCSFLVGIWGFRRLWC